MQSVRTQRLGVAQAHWAPGIKHEPWSQHGVEIRITGFRVCPAMPLFCTVRRAKVCCVTGFYGHVEVLERTEAAS